VVRVLLPPHSPHPPKGYEFKLHIGKVVKAKDWGKEGGGQSQKV